MKKYLKCESLPSAMLLLGLLALGVHQLLNVVAVDRRGLMVPGHPLGIVLWIPSLAALALTAILVRPLSGTPEYGDNFPAGKPAALGSLVLAGCILVTVLLQPCAIGGILAQIWRWMGLGAALALLGIAQRRVQGKAPCFALPLMVCVFLSFHLVSHYRNWSSCPEVLDYVFPLLAGVALVMFSYYHMAFTVGFGMRRLLLASGLMAMFLLVAGFLDTRYQALNLGCLFWVYWNLCAWHVPPAPEKPKEEEPQKEESQESEA